MAESMFESDIFLVLLYCLIFISMPFSLLESYLG